MKDAPHHMAEFIKNFAKTESPKADEILQEFNKPKTEKQIKKQAKIQKRKSRGKKIPHHDTMEEQNKKMGKRTPKIRERSHKTTF